MVLPIQRKHTPGPPATRRNCWSPHPVNKAVAPKIGWTVTGRRVLLPIAVAVAGVMLATSSARAGHGAPVPILTTEPEYAKRLLDAGQPLAFVDLRPPAEFARGRLPRARSIPLGELRRRYPEIPRTEMVILYCDCPPEALAAAFRFVVAEGFQNTSVLAGGFGGWLKRGYPVEPR